MDKTCGTYGEGLIGRIDQLGATNRRLAIECHRLRAALRWIADTGYVDQQSGNQNFEHLQSIARDALAQPKDQSHV